AAVFRVPSYELDARFVLRQRWSLNVDTEHVAKPEIFAHALMHHLLAHTASARIDLIRPYRKVLVFELTPHTQDLQSLGCVALDQKLLFHCFVPRLTQIRANLPSGYSLLNFGGSL